MCKEAGLTERYFYESFADLDALLLATADALFDDIQGQMATAVAEAADGSERTHAVVTILIDVLSGDRRRARLYVESPGHPVLRLTRTAIGPVRLHGLPSGRLRPLTGAELGVLLDAAQL